MIIPVPGSNFATEINNRLQQADFNKFKFAVAWARKKGVEAILPGLNSFQGEKVGIVGLNQRRTSYEAIRILYDRLDELWVFYKHPFQTFHPKLYMFVNEIDGIAHNLSVIIGSSNLTLHGLTRNFELSGIHNLSIDTDNNAVSLSQIISYYDELIESPFSHHIGDINFIDDLLREKYLSTEASLRASTRRSMARRTSERARTLLPEAPPPHVEALEELDVPIPEFARDPVAEAEEVLLPVEAPSPDTMFYVRTLTENDILKAKRQRSGTWEPDLGITARDIHPDFWGWPIEYSQVAGSDRMEWRTNAIFYSLRAPDGIIEEIRLWFRPKREGHAAEHRFRPSSAVKDQVFPVDFDVGSLMVVRRVFDREDVDFRVDFILPDEVTFDGYSQNLTNQRPRHSFGYGLISDFED
jgi:HKD family nuclease